jgi:cytochrome b561
MNGVADSSSLNKPIKINLNICMHFFYFLFFIFIYLLGWAQLSSHGLGWNTQPAQPGSVTGPSQ